MTREGQFKTVKGIKKPNGKLFDFGTSIDYCHAECMAAYIARKGKKKRKGKEGEANESIKCHIGSKQNTDELESNVSLTLFNVINSVVSELIERD